METVHIKLPDKGRVIVMLETLWYHPLAELLLVQNYEGLSVGGPSDKI